MSSVLVLTATTSFPALCQGLTSLRVPRAFVVQLLFLYRYLFLLAEESGRLRRARDLRASRTRAHVGESRGSDGGALHPDARPCRAHLPGHGRARLRWHGPPGPHAAFPRCDALFLAGVAGGAVALRLLPVTVWLGSLGSGR